MEIPKDIATYLTPDEKVEKIFKLKDCIIFASNKRLYIKRGREIQDATYDHISSIRFNSKRYFELIALGIFLLLIAFLFGSMGTPPEFSASVFLLAMICIVIGIFARSEWLEATVVGLPAPLKLEGGRTHLDTLFRLVRDKKEAVKSVPIKHTITPERTSVQLDIFAQIEKLGELKNKGLITEEEFQRKKEELLSRL